MDVVIEFVLALLRRLLNHKWRLHLAGYRVEVICMIVDVESRKKILLTRPRAEPSIWVPPQEGINRDETVEDAAIRCLKTELGLNEDVIHYRRSIWIDKLILPQERADERDLESSLRKYMGRVAMIGKAYYAALIFVPADISLKLNEAEIMTSKWVSINKITTYLNNVDPQKTRILMTGLKRLSLLKQQ
jgi:ADP-ribose pyrophosphatase YjhB (NUDIX family)